MRIDWAGPARADLDELVRYLATDSVQAALDQEARILQAVAKLAAHPDLGRPGRRTGSRELVVPRTPYLVIYRRSPTGLEILRVLHGAQHWPPEA